MNEKKYPWPIVYFKNVSLIHPWFALGEDNVIEPINKMWDIMHACGHNLAKITLMPSILYLASECGLYIEKMRFNELRREPILLTPRWHGKESYYACLNLYHKLRREQTLVSNSEQAVDPSDRDRS